MSEKALTCSLCKYFRRYIHLRVGECYHPTAMEYVDSKDETPVGGVGFTDYEGYQASIYVDQDFGCVNFEEKGTTRASN